MIGLVYRIKLGAFFFNYNIDPVVDNFLERRKNSSIFSIEPINSFETKVTFSDGAEFTFWNSNKYYGWLCYGSIKLKGGSIYRYTFGRPSAKQMYLFLQKIKEAIK